MGGWKAIQAMRDSGERTLGAKRILGDGDFVETALAAGSERQERRSLLKGKGYDFERKRVPGAVVAIARNGKLAYFKAFGQADPVKGVPMATDTIFQLASMTKIQAAVGALALTEQGKLPLQGKLVDYFPAFGTAAPGDLRKYYREQVQDLVYGALSR